MGQVNTKSAIEWNQEADAKYDNFKFKEALLAYEQVLKTDPKNKNVWNNKGMSLKSLGRYQEAFKAFDEAIKIDPLFKEAWNNKGSALNNLGKYSETINVLEQALQIDPRFKDAWSNKGFALKYQGQFVDAISAFETALEIDPKFKEAWNGKGSALADLGEYKYAILSFEEALKIDPKYKNAWNNKGSALENSERYLEAVAAFDEALKIDPKQKGAWNNKSFSLNSLGRFSEGLDACEAALRLDSNYEFAWKNKGISLIGLGRYPEALKALDTALKINPHFQKAKDAKEICLLHIDQSKTQEGEGVSKSLAFITDYQSFPLLKKDDLIDDRFLRSKYDESELRCIGGGSFGKVFLAKRRKESERIAVKVIETNSVDTFEKALVELKSMKKIKDHPNLMTFLSYDINQIKKEDVLFQILIEMPLADCSLEGYMNKTPILKEERVIAIARQLFDGVKYAHDNKLVHMDLKPENVLIIKDVCKIADWGASIQLSSFTSTSIKSEVTGSKGYMAPELEKYGDLSKYNFYLCDVYSLGMILLRICGFSNNRLREIPKVSKKYHDLDFNDEIFPEMIKREFSEGLINLIKMMSAFDPMERISLEGAFIFLSENFS